MKILHLIPSLAYGGRAKPLVLLAPRLPRDRFEARVCCLGAEAPWTSALRRSGVAAECLGRRHPLDLRPLLSLRRAVRVFAPDLVHAWGVTALRALAVAAPRTERVVLSAAVHAARAPHLGALDRRLIAAFVRRVLVAGPAEAERCRHAGVPDGLLAEVPPAVETAPPGATSRVEAGRALGLPEGARYLACVGPFDAAKGFRDAVWAFDILRFVREDLHLLFVGTGPDEPRLREFTRVARVTERVHFVGARADVTDALAHAEAVWVPSHADRGRNVALEAMAAGRAVVASRWPGLAEVVEDGVSGVLVPPGDPAGLARATRLLLDDPERVRALGEAGRKRVEERFGVEAAVRRQAEVYEEAGDAPVHRGA